MTDLSGDSGAIGRLLMAGTKEEPRMQVDLKGGQLPGGCMLEMTITTM